MMTIVIVVGAKYLVVLPLVTFGLFLLIQPWAQQKIIACYAFLVAVLTFAIGKFASILYYNPRPFVAEHFTPLVAHAADNGFPSDHILLAAALSAIAYAFNKKLGMALYIVAVIIGVARVAAGVHHFTDVIASLVIAPIAALVTYRWLYPREIKHS